MENIKLFEEKKVRSHWDEKTEKWYFSVIDVIEILSESPRPRKYWNALKSKLRLEGSELSHSLGQLKMHCEVRTGIENREKCFYRRKLPATGKREPTIAT